MSKAKVIRDMPEEEYHRHPAISKSGLDIFNKSPLHYWSQYLDEMRVNVSTDSTAKKIGSCLHTLVLEPEKYEERFFLDNLKINKRTKEGKEEWRKVQEEIGQRQILSQDEYMSVVRMRDSLYKCEEAKKLLEDLKEVETSIFFNWNLPEREGSVECRARLDGITNSGIIVDLKTTECASPQSFKSSILKYSYHLQDCFYTEAFEKGFDFYPDNFKFVVIEKKPPYCAAVYSVDTYYFKSAYCKLVDRLNAFYDCKKNNHWPGYESQTLEAPEFIKEEVIVW